MALPHAMCYPCASFAQLVLPREDDERTEGSHSQPGMMHLSGAGSCQGCRKNTESIESGRSHMSKPKTLHEGVICVQAHPGAFFRALGLSRRQTTKGLEAVACLFHDRVTRCRVETYQGVPGAKNIPVPFFLGESPQGNESTAKLKVPSRVWRPPGGPRFPRRSRSQRFGDTSYKQDRTVDCLWRPRASSFLCPPVLSRSLPTDGTRTGHQTSWPECFRALSRLLRLLRRTLFVHGRFSA